MPYHVWSAKLSSRLSSWYKVLSDCDADFDQAADKIGIEPTFWHVVGRLRNPLLAQPFHELTFYQRLWIVKSLCDACMVSLLCVEQFDNKTTGDILSLMLFQLLERLQIGALSS